MLNLSRLFLTVLLLSCRSWTVRSSDANHEHSLSAVDYEYSLPNEASLGHYTDSQEEDLEETEVASSSEQTNMSFEEKTVMKMGRATRFYLNGCKVNRRLTGYESTEQSLFLSAYHKARTQLQRLHPEGFTDKDLKKSYLTILMEALGWSIEEYIAYKASHHRRKTRQYANWEVSAPSNAPGPEQMHREDGPDIALMGHDMQQSFSFAPMNHSGPSQRQSQAHHDVEVYDEEFCDDDIYKVGC